MDRARSRRPAAVSSPRFVDRRATRMATRTQLRAARAAERAGAHPAHSQARPHGERLRVLPVMSDELWYKDAIIYQAHVKAFFDSNNDGIGDFAGLTRKLDYLQDLG